MYDVLLSIIIPAYNAEQFLPELLSNLAVQISECKEYSIEIIVVNDGSKDSTKLIAEDFSKKYDFLTVINQENKGECGARNSGIEAARGQFLYFLDSDDAIPAGTLLFFQNLLLEHSMVDVAVFGYAVQRNGLKRKLVYSNILDGQNITGNMIQEKFLTKEMRCCICSLLYRTDFIRDNGLLFPVGVKVGGDVVFMIRAFIKAQQLYYSKRVCFIYQIRNDSVMQGYKGYNIERIRAFELIRDVLIASPEDYAVLKKESNFFIANLYLANLVAYFKSTVKSHTINDIFIRNKFFLYKSIRGRFINATALFLARCLPLRLLLKIFK